MTNTNQFIPIKAPIPITDVTDTIKTITNNDMLVADINTLTNNTVDYKRVNFIKKIQLETNFFNVFRNTIRILLNDYSNSEKRKKIKEECNKKYTYYKTQLDLVINMLRDLVDDTIVFAKKHNLPYTYEEINENEIHTCLSKKDNNCVNNENPKNSICRMTSNTCQLVIPKLNLVNRSDNEKYYYGKMADELIRYNRIKTFMLQPQTYLSFGNIGYDLRENEMILIQSLLTQDYFETLIPAITNKYIKHNSYDEVEPIISQVYDNIIPSLDHAIGRKNITICNKKTNEHISSNVWKKCFPDNYSEIEYNKFNYCTFNFIIDIIEKKTGNKLSINQVKNELFEEYKKYLAEYINKITDILILEGKKTLGDQVHTGTLSFSSLIYTDNYFLTTFDLWLLVTKYKIPTVFICQNYILQTKYEKHEFIGYGNE